MANNLTVNPAYITATVGSFKSSLGTQGKFLTLLVEKVYWFNPNAVGDQVLITDPSSGATLLRLRGEVAGQSQIVDWTAKPRLWADFAVDQIDSGSLEIYLR